MCEHLTCQLMLPPANLDSSFSTILAQLLRCMRDTLNRSTDYLRSPKPVHQAVVWTSLD